MGPGGIEPPTSSMSTMRSTTELRAQRSCQAIFSWLRIPFIEPLVDILLNFVKKYFRFIVSSGKST